jgi:hypothetical protein
MSKGSSRNVKESTTGRRPKKLIEMFLKEMGSRVVLTAGIEDGQVDFLSIERSPKPPVNPQQKPHKTATPDSNEVSYIG